MTSGIILLLHGKNSRGKERKREREKERNSNTYAYIATAYTLTCARMRINWPMHGPDASIFFFVEMLDQSRRTERCRS